jgi:hypothetical protein
MNLISYHHLPSILFISFLKYPNNGTKYLFHSASSYFTSLYSAPIHSIIFHQFKESLWIYLESSKVYKSPKNVLSTNFTMMYMNPNIDQILRSYKLLHGSISFQFVGCLHDQKRIRPKEKKK